MVQSPDKLSRLPEMLERLGLSLFGSFEISESDCPEDRNGLSGAKAALIGNAGQSMWESFSKSAEYSDGLPNPMDRWTLRVLSDIASDFEAQAIFPFENPYWPFQRFAAQAGHANSSPLGILVHPEFGLWHAFRGALVWPQSHWVASKGFDFLPAEKEQVHPCETCENKPCLSACPVDAFDGVTLNRDLCHGHLRSGEGPHCMSMGCRARDACPVGTQFRYYDEQIQFHMRAFGPEQ